MNKKQLIIAWVRNNKELTIFWAMGILISLTFLLTPKKYVLKSATGAILVYKHPNEAHAGISNPALRWDIIIPIIVTILIIGGLLKYTFKRKNK
jgi:hypothetical protein